MKVVWEKLLDAELLICTSI